MKWTVWYNGQFFPARRPLLPAADSAALYGLGVFETLRSAGGRVLFLKDHLERLKKNAFRLGLKIPIPLSKIGDTIYRTLRKNHLRNAYIRINLSRSEETGSPHLTIIAKPETPYARSLYQRGGKMVIVRSVRNDLLPLARIKATNYLTKFLARQEIKKRGAVEGALLNIKGHVTEGASSNIFFIKSGTLLTSPLSEGVMPGTRRSVVVKIARNLKIPVREKIIFPSDLRRADELFITSTLKDLLPIRLFDGKKIGKECPGPITTRLMKAYKTNS